MKTGQEEISTDTLKTVAGVFSLFSIASLGPVRGSAFFLSVMLGLRFFSKGYEGAFINAKGNPYFNLGVFSFCFAGVCVFCEDPAEELQESFKNFFNP